MALSENLQYIRARHNLTQEQLAEQLDVNSLQTGLVLPDSL